MTDASLTGIIAKGPNHRKRWIPLRDAPGFDIARLSTYFPRTPQGLGDCRGFFFNTTAAPHRVTHENLRFESCDLSDGDFAHCNLMSPVFENCRFEACDFTEIGIWDCLFANCTFIRCAFTGQLGVQGRYDGCDFLRCTFDGGRRRSLFGHGLYLAGCSFDRCRFKSIDFKTIRFEGCRFESAFSSVDFLGAAATSHLTGCSAAALENCDLSRSTFKKVRFDPDCVLSNTLFPQAAPHA